MKAVSIVFDETNHPVALEWSCGCYQDIDRNKSIECSAHGKPSRPPQTQPGSGGDMLPGPNFFCLGHPHEVRSPDGVRFEIVHDAHCGSDCR